MWDRDYIYNIYLPPICAASVLLVDHEDVMVEPHHCFHWSREGRSMVGPFWSFSSLGWRWVPHTEIK